MHEAIDIKHIEVTTKSYNSYIHEFPQQIVCHLNKKNIVNKVNYT